jgi:uncharacterized protein (DUF697 family)
MRLPFDVRDITKTGSQFSEERDRLLRIALFIADDAPEELVEAVRSRLRPFTAAVKLHIEVAEQGTKLLVDPSADAVVGLFGAARGGLAPSLAEARERAVPTVVIALAEEPFGASDTLGHPLRDTLVDPDPVRLVEVLLGEWLVERIPSKRLALAHNFVFMRRAVAVEAVKNTAMQNGVIGVVAIIPGADMPLMTANQAKMVLQIAAAYGESLGADRLKELLGVLGGGFLLRTVARQAVAFVPGFGWAVKGGIGYTGTIAMGYAAIRYFENGADLGDLKERLEVYGERVGERLRAVRHRKDRPSLQVVAPDPGLPPAPAGENADGEG